MPVDQLFWSCDSQRLWRLWPAFFMQNESGEVVDKLIPRKCHATNRIIPPHDHASVQFRISKLNDQGLPTGEYETVIFSGYLRNLGEADNALNRIATEKKLLTGVYRQ
jgi:small subunit ribosomal protein S21e